MNALSININNGSHLTDYWEELKRILKNFVKTYREILNGEFKSEPVEKPFKAVEQTEELPKYLWI
jgi:hypothetical protein